MKMKTALRIVFLPVYVLSGLCLLNKWAWNESCWSERNRKREDGNILIDSVWPRHWGKALVRLPAAIMLAPTALCLLALLLVIVPIILLQNWLDKVGPRVMRPLRSFYRRIYDEPMCGDKE